MKLDKKRKQHYVWKYYLKQWTQNKKVFLLYNNEILNTNLDNVANSRDFYRLKELNSNDLIFLQYAINKINDPLLKKLDIDWINTFSEVFKIREKIIKSGNSNKELDNIIDITINNMEEELHSKIENIGSKYLKMILEQDLSFFETDEGFIEFTLYLCMQYFRTENMKNQALQSEIADSSFIINMDNVWSIFKILFATNMAYTLYASKEDWKMQLLENGTEIPFITGDQPVINEYSIPNTISKELSLYYPVSPILAIRISKELDRSKSSQICTKKDVIIQNKKIKNNSYQQIYGNTKSSLETFITK